MAGPAFRLAQSLQVRRQVRTPYGWCRMVPAFEIVGGGQQDVLVTAEGEAADVDAAV
jgi:hypothetical protein